MTATTNSLSPSRSGGAPVASARAAGDGSPSQKRLPGVRRGPSTIVPSAHHHPDGLGAHLKLAGFRLINEANAREHWRQQAARVKREREITTLGLTRLGCPDWAHMNLTIMLTRVSPGMLDGDGLQSSLKHVRDAVAAWLGVDDAEWRKGNRIAWQYDQRRGGKGEYSVQILFRAKEAAAQARFQGVA